MQDYEILGFEDFSQKLFEFFPGFQDYDPEIACFEGGIRNPRNFYELGFAGLRNPGIRGFPFKVFWIFNPMGFLRAGICRIMKSWDLGEFRNSGILDSEILKIGIPELQNFRILEFFGTRLGGPTGAT